ncbi:unnamed protein product [Allacma fusca]|uniref:Factor VIII intron 22 protein n=1 Tax=Allacma fusca TaxID=39272 RepID=A0A8J2JD98_9HEXA|nr:unnamed protein product [Allacma fusca]
MNPVFSNNTDFLPQFKAIGQSLKRRFFRKPNVSDAVDQYEALYQELQREEQKEFAAICCLEAAKCQETLQNPIPQANLLVKAAKLYLQARNSYKDFENEDYSFCDLENERGSASHGYSQIAVQSLDQAAKIFKTHKYFGMSLVIIMQTGQVLYEEHDYGEALKHFKSALDIAKMNFTLADQLVVLEQVLKCKVRLTDYESVSKTVGDILIILNQHRDEVPDDMWHFYVQRFEIMRVCLILILGVNSVDLVKFIWPEGLSKSEDGDQERKEVLIHLKSLVLAVQNGSVKEIKAVENNLSHTLTEMHQDLFTSLIQMQM